MICPVCGRSIEEELRLAREAHKRAKTEQQDNKTTTEKK